MHRKDIESEEARGRLSEAEGRLASCEAEAAVLNANIESSLAQTEQILKDLEQQRSRIDEIRAEIARGEARLQEIGEEGETLGEKLKSAENVLAGCRMKLSSREDLIRRQTDALNAAEVELNSMDARIRMLTDMQRDYEGYSRAVKTVMREADRGILKGIHGPVSGLVHTDGEFALAIETALGSAGQNIVTDSQNDGKLAIELLQRQDAGRATFLPLETIRGSIMKDAPVRDPGFVGLASELVDYDPKYEQIILNLLFKRKRYNFESIEKLSK